MSTPNGVGGVPSGSSPIFGFINDLTRTIGQGYSNLTPLWSQQNPTPTTNANAPTFAGTPAQPTTASPAPATPVQNYMPIVLVGGALLVLIVLLK